MAENSELIKLKIIGFTDNGFSSKSGEFDVLINPETYKQSYSINYSDDENMGDVKKGPKFKDYGSEKVDFKIVMDGTGIVPGGKKVKTVSDQLKSLKDIVYDYEGDIHQPKFIKLVWGKLIFDCRLTSMTVDYVLFTPSGEPLRANVDLSFVEYTSVDQEIKEKNASSPDMSHLITVKAGDTIQKLCFDIYKDTKYCMQIAAVNNLTNFRNVKPGMRLLFPPINKNG
ncbi:MAG: hypothetical protein N4A72_18690 [Bacteroidales bacterium]|jgi:nucleoid-associated protein YgaU|nr:hypothetical protein [Bacteroidales bacterium]